jgi:CubicO group peptidase (beta-lactamase class C family)
MCSVFELRRIVLAFVSLAVVHPAVRGDDPLRGIDAYVADAMAQWKVPGLAIAVVKDGKVVFAKGYGVRKAGGKAAALDGAAAAHPSGAAVDENTVFPIASATKMFTVTGLAMLVDEGKLKWSDRVTKHLPTFRLHDDYVTQHVTLADLVSHRTGYETADLLAYRGDYDRAEILRRMRYLKPYYPFRTRWKYNNLMVVAAGEILERVSRKRWDDFVTARILKPLRMDRTATSGSAAAKLDNRSTHHTLVDGKLQPDPFHANRERLPGLRRLERAVAPAGAMSSSVADLTRFLLLHLDEGRFEGRQLVSAAGVRTMMAQHSSSPILTRGTSKMPYSKIYFGNGLGWQLRDYRGRKVVMHGGSSGAVIAMMPAERIGIAVLGNRDRSGIVYMMMHDLFDRFLGIRRPWTTRDWVVENVDEPARKERQKLRDLERQRAKDTKPTFPLERYAGTYECDLYGKLVVEQSSGKLRVRFGPNFTTTLKHWERDTFRASFPLPWHEQWIVRFKTERKPDRVNEVRVRRIFWYEAMPVFRRVGASHGR